MGNSFRSIDRLATGLAGLVIRWRWLVVVAALFAAVSYRQWCEAPRVRKQLSRFLLGGKPRVDRVRESAGYLYEERQLPVRVRTG